MLTESAIQGQCSKTASKHQSIDPHMDVTLLLGFCHSGLGLQLGTHSLFGGSLLSEIVMRTVQQGLPYSAQL